MKRLLYISHPSGGLLENTLDTEVVIKKLYDSDLFFNNISAVSPIHNYGFMYRTTEYNRGLAYCTDLLERCDAMLLVGDYSNSVGCKAEKQLCIEKNIPFIEVESSDKINNELINKLVELVK